MEGCLESYPLPRRILKGEKSSVRIRPGCHWGDSAEFKKGNTSCGIFPWFNRLMVAFEKSGERMFKGSEDAKKITFADPFVVRNHEGPGMLKDST